MHHYRGAPFFRNVFDLTVSNRARIVPRAEHCTDGTPELFLRILGEGEMESVLDQGFELGDQFAQIVRGELGVQRDTPGGFLVFNECFKGITLSFGFRFESQDHISVHLYKTAVAIVGEARIAGLLDQTLDSRVVEAQVQHSVHHARHRHPSTRADREQQRIFRIAKAPAHDLLDPCQAVTDLFIQLRWVAVLARIIVGTYLGGDRHARRHRQPQASHLGQVRTLATEQPVEPGVTLSFATTKRVNVAFAPAFCSLSVVLLCVHETVPPFPSLELGTAFAVKIAEERQRKKSAAAVHRC